MPADIFSLMPNFALQKSTLAAKDKFHETVRIALEKDGWTITHDPYVLRGKPRQEIDFGAERLIAAERGAEKIAVEVKSFLGASQLYDFYEALGQYILYQISLSLQDPDRKLFIAMPEKSFKHLAKFDTVRLALERENVHVLGFDPENETFVQL